MKKITITIIFLSFFTLIEPVNASMKWIDPDLEILDKIISLTPAKDLKCEGDYCWVPWIGEAISGIYKYAIGIAGILAAITLIIGGVIWLTAGGNSAKVSEAKTWITSSITGLFIAMASYLILFQINPDLLNFNALKIKNISDRKYINITKPNTGRGCCELYYDSRYACFENLSTLECATEKVVLENAGATVTNEKINLESACGEIANCTKSDSIIDLLGCCQMETKYPKTSIMYVCMDNLRKEKCAELGTEVPAGVESYRTVFGQFPIKCNKTTNKCE